MNFTRLDYDTNVCKHIPGVFTYFYEYFLINWGQTYLDLSTHVQDTDVDVFNTQHTLHGYVYTHYGCKCVKYYL